MMCFLFLRDENGYKCGQNRMWDDEDLAGIENSLASRLDDNENDIKVI
jgi:hypothetical protein